MRWLCPEERKASAEEFDEYVRKLKAEYKTLTRKTRPRILFVDDQGKEALFGQMNFLTLHNSKRKEKL